METVILCFHDHFSRAKRESLCSIPERSLCDHTDYQTACSDITQWTLIEGVRF